MPPPARNLDQVLLQGGMTSVLDKQALPRSADGRERSAMKHSGPILLLVDFGATCVTFI